MGTCATPSRESAATRARPSMSRSASRRPAQLAATGRSTSTTPADGSVHSVAGASGRMRRITRSVVHCTVAIVGMPSFS